MIVEKTDGIEDSTPEAPADPNQPIIFSETPPTQHWKICQQIIRSWGGDLQFIEHKNDQEGQSNQDKTGKQSKFSTRLLLVASQ